MLKQTITIIASSLLMSASMSVNQSSQPTAYDDDEAYDVYSAILPSEWPISYAKAKRLVIRAETKAYKMCLRPEKESEGLVGPAISDYVKANEKTWLLQNNIRLAVPYKLVGSHELQTSIEGSGWDGFYKQYPDSGGWIELSAVGFNADRTVAVVYMGHSCGNLCGGGSFHVLQKKDGAWVALDWKGISCAWAS